MIENISDSAKRVIVIFRKLNESEKLYFMSILLSHVSNGLINDGNYLDSDLAYENDALVLEPNDMGLVDIMGLATSLLLIASKKDGLTINPNGIDIEPYIKDKTKLSSIISNYYKLDFNDKIDAFIEIFYDILEIEEVKSLNLGYQLIDRLLTYRKAVFNYDYKTSLEVN